MASHFRGNHGSEEERLFRRIKYKDDFKFFTSPFDVDVESAPSEVQMELVDLQCSNELKSRFAAVGHADFWRKHVLPTKCFPGLVDNAMRTVAAFSCT